MTSSTGKSHAQDPVDEDTGQIHLPASSESAVYCGLPAPGRAMSGLLVTCLCTAVTLTIAATTLAIIEAVRSTPAVTHTAMLLLTAAAAASWVTAIITAGHDRLVRCSRSLRGGQETIQSRQLELYRRQDHLALRFADLVNRQVEQMAILREIAQDVAAIRREMGDVLGVADADAELHARQAVNGVRPTSGGLYVVPPGGKG